MKRFLLLLLLVLPFITACDSQLFSKSSIVGTWYHDSGTGYRSVYTFTSNTVRTYSTVKDSKSGWTDVANVKTVPGMSGWYYCSTSARDYGYWWVNSTSICTEEGKTFTFNNGQLYSGGISYIKL